MTGTDMPRRSWGVRAVLALIARATRTTLPAAVGGHLPSGGTDKNRVILSQAMHVPSGHDPYGPHFAEEDCVLSTRTGRCIRGHPCPEGS